MHQAAVLLPPPEPTLRHVMAVRSGASRLAHKPGQRIARLLSACFRTGLVRAASAVDLARRDTRETDARTFSAPDRTIAVPDPGGRTCESLSGRNNNRRGGCQE